MNDAAMANRKGQPTDPVSPRLFDRGPSERLVLSIIQKAGALPSAEIARLAGLSAQSASVLTRALEADGLIVKGEPVRGKVGKPLTPFMLNKDGAYSIGLRIGRRSADMVLLDFCGTVRGHIRATYPYPTPARIMDIARSSMERLLAEIGPANQNRVAGIGVGAPFELWKWLDRTGTPQRDMMAWKDFSFHDAFAEFTDLPVLVGNDGSLACNGEHAFGGTVDHPNFVYMYVGSFIGGGIVLNNRLFAGQNGNAGAFGSLPVRTRDGSWQQMISHASVIQLEEALEARWPGQAQAMLQQPDWTGFDDLLDTWLTQTSEALAYAALTVVAIFDAPDVVVDCGAPAKVRQDLVARIDDIISKADARGIERPRVVSGKLGPMAGALGAGYLAIVSRLLVD